MRDNDSKLIHDLYTQILLNEENLTQQERIDLLKSSKVLSWRVNQANYKIFEIPANTSKVHLSDYKMMSAQDLLTACEKYYEYVRVNRRYDEELFFKPNNIATNRNEDLGYFDITADLAVYILGPGNIYYNEESSARRSDAMWTYLLMRIVQLGENVMIRNR